jgi:hypothetical protein
MSISDPNEPVVRVHLAGADPGAMPGMPAGLAGLGRCVESTIFTKVSAANDNLGVQQLIGRSDQYDRVMLLLPHGTPGGGNPNTTYGWIGNVRSEVEKQLAGYIQGTGQGPIWVFGPEQFWFQADPASGTQLGITVYAYYFERQ